MVDVAAVLVALVTVALNASVCVWYSVAVVGVTVTDTGGKSVTLAVADFVASVWLVAVTVTVCFAVPLAGAVLSPAALTLPAPLVGPTVQLTVLLLALPT